MKWMRFAGAGMLALALGLLMTPRAAALQQRESVALLCAGEVTALDAPLLETALGIAPKRLQAVTVLALPDPAVGTLYCEGVAVRRYDELPRNELQSLVFVPSEAMAAQQLPAVSHLSLLPRTAREAGRAAQVALLYGGDAATRAATAVVEAEHYAWAWAQTRYYTCAARAAGRVGVR